MANSTPEVRRSRIANYILITAAVLLLLAYPFQDFFWGGFLTHLAVLLLLAALLIGMLLRPCSVIPWESASRRPSFRTVRNG